MIYTYNFMTGFDHRALDLLVLAALAQSCLQSFTSISPLRAPNFSA